MVKAVDGSKEPCILLVEGKDDESVVYHLSQSYTKGSEFKILKKEGIDNLLADIFAEVEANGRKAIGIMVDANSNLTSIWDKIKKRLKKADIILPNNPDTNGTIIPSKTRTMGDRRAGKPRVGVWVMPDNKSSGELEDFINRMIPDDDPVRPLSKEYIERIIDRIPAGERKFTLKKSLRAEVYAWLATRERPRQMGAAVNARDLNIQEENCQLFIDWLRRLFDEP